MAPLRALVPLVLIALLTSACGSTGSGTTGPVTPVAALGTFDQAFVDQMTGEGWSEAEAITLALTKLSVISWDEHTVRILESLPTGETVDLTITLTPGGTGDPNALTTTSADTPDGFTFTLAYHIARTARVAGPDLASTNGVPHIALARFVPAQAPRGPVFAADGGSGGDVLVTAVVKKGTEAIFDAYWDALKAFLTKAGTLDPFIQTLKSAGSVFDALDLRTKYAALHARIDAAEKCARNPTNPLTIAAYAADPGVLDRLLEQVDDTLRSVKVNVAAVYLLNLNEGVADLLKQAPWLGIALGSGGAWAADNFDKDNEARVSALEASIVGCIPVAWQGTVTYTETTSRALSEDQGCVLGACGSGSMDEQSAGRVTITITAKDLETSSGPSGEGQGFIWQAGAETSYSRTKDQRTHATDEGGYSMDLREMETESGAGSQVVGVTLSIFSGSYSISFDYPSVDTSKIYTATLHEICGTKAFCKEGDRTTTTNSTDSWYPSQRTGGGGRFELGTKTLSGQTSGTEPQANGSLVWTLTWTLTLTQESPSPTP